MTKSTGKSLTHIHASRLCILLFIIRYLTRITYIFPTNSSTFRCRRTRISTRTRSDFPHDSAVIFRKIPRGRIYGGRNSARIRAENETQ